MQVCSSACLHLLLACLSPAEVSAFANSCLDHREHIELALVWLALQVLGRDQDLEDSSSSFALVSDSRPEPGLRRLFPQMVCRGGSAAEDLPDDLSGVFPSQGELDLGFFAEAEAGSFQEAGVAFAGSSNMLDHATSARSLESEDRPLSELLLSEPRWWEQVRDAAPVAQVDPLEGKAVDLRSTFRSACQLQGPSPGPEGLTQPWDEGVFWGYLRRQRFP